MQTTYPTGRWVITRQDGQVQTVKCETQSEVKFLRRNMRKLGLKEIKRTQYETKQNS